MTDPTKSPSKSRSTLKTKLIIAEQILLYTALVAGISFYYGNQYAQAQSAKTAAAIHDAVKAAATPAAVAKAAPEKN